MKCCQMPIKRVAATLVPRPHHLVKDLELLGDIPQLAEDFRDGIPELSGLLSSLLGRDVSRVGRC